MAQIFVLGFDVYGTLVDPLAMAEHLRRHVGEDAAQFALLWRQKQLEYAFRRAAMQQYENFDLCTLHALRYALQAMHIALTPQQEEHLLRSYERLPAFPDAVQGLQALRGLGHRLLAFSNGVDSTVRTLLANAGLINKLEGIVSVDDLQTFKPSPAVYRYLLSRTQSSPERTWLISSNPWDIIGAKGAGLQAAWIRRQVDQVFDPWGIEPDLTAVDLLELAEQFERLA